MLLTSPLSCRSGITHKTGNGICRRAPVPFKVQAQRQADALLGQRIALAPIVVAPQVHTGHQFMGQPQAGTGQVAVRRVAGECEVMGWQAGEVQAQVLAVVFEFVLSGDFDK